MGWFYLGTRVGMFDVICSVQRFFFSFCSLCEYPDLYTNFQWPTLLSVFYRILVT